METLPRITASEGVAAYLAGNKATTLVHYDPEQHEEQMKAVVTGVAGAMLKLGLRSLSGPEIGSSIPVVVTNVPGDVIRIFVDPYVEAYGPEEATQVPYIKKAREHVELTALTYTGEGLLLDTAEMGYTNYKDLSVELQYQAALFEKLRRELPF